MELRLRYAVTGMVCLALAAPVAAQTPGVRSFQRVTPSFGWALVGRTLLSSNTAGKQWTDVTPARDGGAAPDAAFFLDDSTGWALVRTQAGGRIQVARTADGGRSWSAGAPLQHEDLALYRGGASLSFSDSLNGLVMLRLASSANFSRGVLFATADGGVTWTARPTPPLGDAVVTSSPATAWLAGGPAGDELWVTRDRGLTWQRVTLRVPASVGSIEGRSVDMPVFVDDDNGALAVRYRTAGATTLVVYRSTDAGRTWAARTIEAVAEENTVVALANGSIVRPSDRAARLASPSAAFMAGRIVRANFTDNLRGWALTLAGGCTDAKQNCAETRRLLASEDGGATFTDITPAAPADIRQPLDAPPTWTQSTVTSQNVEGFDKCEIASVSQMQTWRTSSPYIVVGAYIGGNHRACANSGLTTTWASTVIGQGWRMLPIWVGPQPPGLSAPNISTTLSTAEQQGRDEAALASDRLAALNLSPAIVYYDIEAYSRTNAAFRAAVQAFVNGWVQGMHSRGNLAGVYSSHPSFQDWVPGAIANVPDAIWFAYYFQTGVACGAACHTVFGVPDISDGLWSNDQRARQTSSTIDRCWGNVCFTGVGGVDEDWVDGPTATVSGGDTIFPTVSAFSVNPGTVSPGAAFSIQATVSDAGGSHLSRIELWRAPDAGGVPGVWAGVTTLTLSGDGPLTVTFTDTPAFEGDYWYGVHLFDGAGHQTNEPSPARVSVRSPSKASVVSPSPGATLGTSATFSWTTGVGVTFYDLTVGSSPGGRDLFDAVDGVMTSVFVSSLPSDGRTLYVRLWSFISPSWQFNDYVYTASTSSPGYFTKSAPPGGSSGLPLSLTLTWNTSAGATSYEYCIDTTNNGVCDGAWAPAAGTGAAVSGLAFNTTYAWQVRARNAGGATEADGGAWWTLTTMAPPTPPTIRLKVNGQHPNPALVTTTGAYNLTLDVSASNYNAPVSWYWGFSIGGQVWWVTPTGLSVTPAPFTVAPPGSLTNAALLNTTLPAGTTLTSFVLFVDASGSVVASDVITARR